MKRFLTFFAIFLALQCAVDETQAQETVPESRKADIVIPGAHGNDVKITVLGQKDQTRPKVPSRRQQQYDDSSPECLAFFNYDEFYTTEDGSRYFTPEALQTLVDVLSNSAPYVQYDYTQSTSSEVSGPNVYPVTPYDGRKIACAMFIFQTMTQDYLKNLAPPQSAQQEAAGAQASAEDAGYGSPEDSNAVYGNQEPSTDDPEGTESITITTQDSTEESHDDTSTHDSGDHGDSGSGSNGEENAADQQNQDVRRRRQAVRVNVRQAGFSHQAVQHTVWAPARRQAQVPQKNQQAARFRNIFRPAI